MSRLQFKIKVTRRARSALQRFMGAARLLAQQREVLDIERTGLGGRIEVLHGLAIFRRGIDVVEGVRSRQIDDSCGVGEQELPRAASVGCDEVCQQRLALGLPDGAQRLRQPVVGGTECGRHPRRVAPGDQRPQGGGVEEGQIAGQHQPGRSRPGPQRREDPGDRSDTQGTVDHLSVACPQRIRRLIGAYRHEVRTCDLTEQLEGDLQLVAAVIGEHGLVTAHPRAAPAGEHQAAQRPGHRRETCRRGPWSRLPPRLTSSRIGPMRMSCDSALHMS